MLRIEMHCLFSTLHFYYPDAMKRILFTSVLFCIFSTAGFAQETQGFRAKLLIDAGIEYGGDELLTVFFTNGDDQTMLAGQGGYIAAGGQISHSSLNKLLLRGSVGIKYNTTAATNANITLTRFPVNLVGYWSFTDKVRVGAGITSHQAVKLKGDGVFPDEDFTSSTGVRFEIGYAWAALTYTIVDYTDSNDQTFSANSLGLSLSFLLPVDN